MKIYLLIILLLTGILPAKAQSDGPAVSSDIPTITFCDLIRSPDLYHEKDVRFRARYLANAKVAAFGDPNCTIKENRTWAEFDGISIKASAKPAILEKVEGQILCGSCGADDHWRETEMLVTGTFDGSDTGHGRMGKYRFKVTVRSVEEIGETEQTKAPGFSP